MFVPMELVVRSLSSVVECMIPVHVVNGSIPLGFILFSFYLAN